MKNVFLNIILLINEYNLLIISTVLSFFIFTFLIDGFKLSDNKYIRFFQIILFIIMGGLIILFIYQYFLGIPLECATNEEGNLSNHSKLKKDSEINLGVNGNVYITKEGGEAIAKSVTNAAGQLGIGATVGGVAAAVSSVIKTTSLPPMQKIGLTLASGAVGGLIHTGTTAANRALASGVVNNQSTNQSTVNAGRLSPSEEFSPASPLDLSNLDSQIFSGTDNSVEILLSSIYSLNIISLILNFALILNLIIKFNLINNLELKWLNNLIPQPYNSRFKSLFLKILKYIGKSNTINITLIIIILLISNIGSVYLLTILINNFEIFCKVYLNNLIK